MPYRYMAASSVKRVIERTIVESRSEYKFLGLTYERDGVQLKKVYADLWV